MALSMGAWYSCAFALRRSGCVSGLMSHMIVTAFSGRAVVEVVQASDLSRGTPRLLPRPGRQGAWAANCMSPCRGSLRKPGDDQRADETSWSRGRDGGVPPSAVPTVENEARRIAWRTRIRYGRQRQAVHASAAWNACACAVDHRWLRRIPADIGGGEARMAEFNQGRRFACPFRAASGCSRGETIIAISAATMRC